MTRLLFLLLALGLGGAAPPPGDFYVMRHLERGPGADPELDAEGKRNADTLAELLGGRHLAAIYVSDTRRARQTAAPLAARRRLVVKVYAPLDLDGLIARVRQEKGPVLIVGHSNTVPDIVVRLGGRRPADIPDDRYGDIWHVFGRGPATEQSRLGNGDRLNDLPR